VWAECKIVGASRNQKVKQSPILLPARFKKKIWNCLGIRIAVKVFTSFSVLYLLSLALPRSS
jgi:hypothetical protein